jgi:general secretion pathway protein D
MMAFLCFNGGTAVFAQDAMIEELKQEMKTPAGTNQPVVKEPAVQALDAEVPAVKVDEQKPEAAPAEAPAPAAAPKADALIEELAPAKPVVEVEAVKAPAAPAAEPKADVLIEELAPAPVAKPAEVPAVKTVAEKPAADELKLEDVLAPAAPAEVKAAEAAPVPAVDAEAVLDLPKTVTAETAVKQLGSAERTEMATLIAQQEEVRRQARELEGRKSVDSAERAWKSGDYLLALNHYRSVVEKLPAVGPNMTARKRALERIPECEYQVILSLVKQGKKTEALTKGKDALTRNPDNAPLSKLVRKLESDPPPPPPPPKGTDEGPTTAQKKSEVQEQMHTAKQQMAAREYEKARASFESVLAIEPENREAMSYLKELGDRKYVSNTAERNATAAKMTAQVRDTWNPQYKMIKAVEEKVDRVNPTPPSKSILDKMDKIVIPEIEFRQANIHDVVEFLNRASVDGDKTTADPTQRGVNIILNLSAGGAQGAAAAPAAKPSADDVFGAGQPAGGAAGGGQTYEITFTARYITLLSALKIITSVAGLKWRVDGNIVMIVPADFDPSEIEVRMYSVEPTFVERIREAGSAMPAPTEQLGGREMNRMQNEAIGPGVPELKEYFEKMGVKFPKGSSITYNSAIGKVIVGNTAENLATFEKILPELNVVPKQVEIEARFVEVNETDLQEIGLEWLLNDAWEIASKGGGAFAPLGSTERVQMNANSGEGGFTKGLRFWGDPGSGSIDTLGAGQGTMGRLMSVSSVLTNPELSMVLHLLQQNGNADLLSAPKVTTRSGAEASIRVVTEYIYPTSFDVQGGTLQSSATGTGASTVQETTVVPQDFATREVGVILTVLPEVSPDGNMINLTMTPMVVTEPTWFQYGSTVRRADGSESVLNMPQPFFHVRSLSTQISIYDGATVVMGGLITEDLRKVNDKIPVLGDIPLIGVLFRSKSERSIKKNLLIFVTAKLVDPAGRLIRNPEAEVTAPLKVPLPGSAAEQPK